MNKPEQIKDCTYKTFDRTKLTNTKPIQKIIPPKPGRQPIPPSWQIPLQYNMGTETNPLFSDFEMVFPEFTSPVGISRKEMLNEQTGDTRIDESILVKFDPSNPNHNELLECLDTLYNRT